MRRNTFTQMLGGLSMALGLLALLVVWLGKIPFGFIWILALLTALAAVVIGAGVLFGLFGKRPNSQRDLEELHTLGISWVKKLGAVFPADESRWQNGDLIVKCHFNTIVGDALFELTASAKPLGEHVFLHTWPLPTTDIETIKKLLSLFPDLKVIVEKANERDFRLKLLLHTDHYGNMLYLEDRLFGGASAWFCKALFPTEET